MVFLNFLIVFSNFIFRFILGGSCFVFVFFFFLSVPIILYLKVLQFPPASFELPKGLSCQDKEIQLSSWIK